ERNVELALLVHAIEPVEARAVQIDDPSRNVGTPLRAHLVKILFGMLTGVNLQPLNDLVEIVLDRVVRLDEIVVRVSDHGSMYLVLRREREIHCTTTDEWFVVRFDLLRKARKDLV